MQAGPAPSRSEYERLRRDTALGRYSVLDKYGATDPAEFFAVATEAFFEKSLLLWKRHPELYGQLEAYYRQDPARWPTRDSPRRGGHDHRARARAGAVNPFEASR